MWEAWACCVWKKGMGVRNSVWVLLPLTISEREREREREREDVDRAVYKVSRWQKYQRSKSKFRFTPSFTHIHTRYHTTVREGERGREREREREGGRLSIIWSSIDREVAAYYRFLSVKVTLGSLSLSRFNVSPLSFCYSWRDPSCCVEHFIAG